MLKYIRNGLIIFTNNGMKKIEDIDKNIDKILIYKDGKYEYGEIDNIEKIYKKNYKLNKVSFINSIDNYYMNDNIELKSISNIPSNIELTSDIPEYLNYNKKRCIGMNRLANLSSFDYIGFPLDVDNGGQIKDELEENKEYYRWMGLILSKSTLSFYINKDKEETIKFVEEYLKKNEISYEITIIDNNVVIKYENEILDKKLRKIDIKDILNISKDNLREFVKGLIEIDNQFVILNRENYQMIKYGCLRLGVIISSYYKDDKYNIRISKNLKNCHYNYFNYDNFVWSKIRNIKKFNYNGLLYRIVLMEDNPYLTDIGIIS
jgi:hypothetical protein